MGRRLSCFKEAPGESTQLSLVMSLLNNKSVPRNVHKTKLFEVLLPVKIFILSLDATVYNEVEFLLTNKA